MHRLQVLGTLLMIALLMGTAAFAYADNDDNSGRDKGKGSDSSMSQEQRIVELKSHIKALQDQIQAMVKLQVDLGVSMKDRRNASTSEERKSIKEDIHEIKDEIRDVRSDVKAEVRFMRSLMRGASGDDVRDLQELLAQDSDIYPEGLITGFFGPATERALKKFQKKHGLEQVGVCGPKTRALLEQLFNGHLPLGILKRLGIFATTTGTTTPGVAQITICHYPPGNVAAKQTLTIGVAALAAHLMHGDRLGACESGTATTTPPIDTTAPVISGISATSTTASTSLIVWTTNEAADSTVWYGTTTPILAASPTLSITNSVLVTSHSVLLSGLSASTTQYFAVGSKDAAGNAATSSTQSFLTL